MQTCTALKDYFDAVDISQGTTDSSDKTRKLANIHLFNPREKRKKIKWKKSKKEKKNDFFFFKPSVNFESIIYCY